VLLDLAISNCGASVGGDSVGMKVVGEGGLPLGYPAILGEPDRRRCPALADELQRCCPVTYGGAILTRNEGGNARCLEQGLSISAFTTSKYFRSVVIVAGGDEY